MSNTLPLFTALSRSVAEIQKSAPRELRRLLLLNFIVGAGPVIALYLQKLIIDYFALALTQQNTPQTWVGTPAYVIAAIALLVFVNIALDSVETLSGFEFASLRDRIQGHLRVRIFEKVTSFPDILMFENPELLNIKQAAQQAIPRVQQLTQVIGNMMTGVFVFVPVFIISFSIAWWVPILIFATAIPSILVQTKYENIAWSIEYSQVGLNRKMHLYEQVLTHESYAKEIRMFGLQGYMLGLWKTIFQDALKKVLNVRSHGALVITTWSLLSGVGIAIVFVYIFTAVLNGRISLGDLALYSGIVFQVRRSLYIMLGNASSLREAALSSTAIFTLLDLQPANVTDSSAVQENRASDRADVETSDQLEVKNVSFRYPGSDREAVSNINLSLKPNTLTVVVGENGAGKTTLSKLICRLYAPTTGSILWNNQDINAFEIAAWRRQIVIVFQDFARFPMPVRHNIGFGNISQLEDDAGIIQNASRVNLHGVIADLPQGLEPPLTKQVENGSDLSGGQWQRVAIARAMMRQASTKILILDEPTSSLDPNTEHEVYGLFKEMARDKTTLIVSHRLGLARIADNIIVMDAGRIVEQGHHDDLMKLNGIYHSMFVKQASSYFDVTNNTQNV